MYDQPLWSPRRLLLACRRWVWWGGDQGLFFPFWWFLRYEGRPNARSKCRHEPDIWFTKTPWEV